MDSLEHFDADECRLCQLLIETRVENIKMLRDRIAMNDSEIAEVRRGDRHTDFHREAAARD